MLRVNADELSISSVFQLFIRGHLMVPAGPKTESTLIICPHKIGNMSVILYVFDELWDAFLFFSVNKALPNPHIM